MMYIKLLFLLLVLILEKCSLVSRTIEFPEEKLEETTPKKVDTKNFKGTWRLADQLNVTPLARDEKDKLLQEARKKKKLKEGVLLSFFPDSTFTEIKGSGAYRSGTWKYIENSKILILTEKNITERFVISIASAENNRRKLNLTNVRNQDLLTFLDNGNTLKDYQEDPFYCTNNAWRIKPSGSESSEQVSDRLNNYLKHNAYILKSAGERKQEIVSWEFSEGIVKIYRGGIGVVSEDRIPESWVNTFHNSEDAMQAYQLFQHYVAGNNFRGAASGDWVKDDYAILTSIYGDANSKKPRPAKAR